MIRSLVRGLETVPSHDGADGLHLECVVGRAWVGLGQVLTGRVAQGVRRGMPGDRARTPAHQAAGLNERGTVESKEGHVPPNEPGHG